MTVLFIIIGVAVGYFIGMAWCAAYNKRYKATSIIIPKPKPNASLDEWVAYLKQERVVKMVKQAAFDVGCRNRSRNNHGR